MALINLTANARDAMQGRGQLEILARVFDPFFTTKPVGSGTGLGLAQVHSFCEQAGGGVQLESDVGVGTTVSLFLPQALAMSDAIARRPMSRPAEAA